MRRTVTLCMLIASLVALGAVFGCNDDDNPTGLTGNGEVLISPRPINVDFPWRLEGPDGTVEGVNYALLTDMPPGDYSITWLPLAGWLSPDDTFATGRLSARGAVLTFTATYRNAAGSVSAGQVVVDVSPDTIDAAWTLEGPEGFSFSGTGDHVFENMPPGIYTVTWEPVEGFNTPLSVSEELAEGQGLVLEGHYTEISLSELHFVTITAGEFQMGSVERPSVTDPMEYPRHLVRLTHDFEMSETEVTWAQFEDVMGYNPSAYGEQCASCPSHPVESVSWLEAVQFCNALSDAQGYQRAYTIVGDEVTWNRDADGYRLPTEAEWEYACRAGTPTSYSNGDIELEAGSCYLEPHLEEMGWYCYNAGQAPHATGELSPNAWGLFDMHGNVWEWVWDWSSEHYDQVTLGVDSLRAVDGSVVYGLESLVAVRNALPVSGSGNVLHITDDAAVWNTSALGITVSGITVAVADFGDLVNIQVNGAPMYRGPLADAPTDIAPGVTLALQLSDVTDPDEGDGRAGTLVFTGDVAELRLGGENLWVDDLVVQDADTGPFGRDRTVDFEMSALGAIYPLGSTSILACTVTDPIGPPPAPGIPHMLRGGGFLSNPRDCRSATRSRLVADKTGPYAGFRVVRTLD